jgi:hypothetical protein
MARYWWLGLLASFGAAMVPVPIQAYYGYGHPTYGYSYGPEFNYGYFAAPIFGRAFVALCRKLGLLSAASVAIDGSKFKAVSRSGGSPRRSKTPAMEG